MDRRAFMLAAASLAMSGSARAERRGPAAAAPNPFAFVNPFPGLDTFSDTTGRTSVSPLLVPAERTFIGIIEGQSLAGDHCQGLYSVSSPKVQSVNSLGDRLLYQHAEPMMGTSFYPNGYANWNAGYGSVWGEAGDLLISGGKYDRVIWCNVSYGGQYARDLAPSGHLGHRLPLAFAALQSLGYAPSKVTAIVSMLGESDGVDNTAASTFSALRQQTIAVSRNLGFRGKWFIPLETSVYGTTSSSVRAGQAALVNPGAGIVQGPDFDTLDHTYRYVQPGTPPGDGTIHPNATGRQAISVMWANNLIANL